MAGVVKTGVSRFAASAQSLFTMVNMAYNTSIARLRALEHFFKIIPVLFLV